MATHLHFPQLIQGHHRFQAKRFSALALVDPTNIGSVCGVAAIAFLLAACAGEDQQRGGGPGHGAQVTALTCDVLDRPNCWDEVLDELLACAPGPDAGSLETGRSCAFASGHLVTFEPALPFDDDGDFSLVVDAPGGRCGELVKTGRFGETRTFEITTSIGTAWWGIEGSRLRLGCPDGTVHETTVLAALDCERYPDVFGYFVGTSAHHAELGFTRGDEHIFTCRADD